MNQHDNDANIISVDVCIYVLVVCRRWAQVHQSLYSHIHDETRLLGAALPSLHTCKLLQNLQWHLIALALTSTGLPMVALRLVPSQCNMLRTHANSQHAHAAHTVHQQAAERCASTVRPRLNAAITATHATLRQQRGMHGAMHTHWHAHTCLQRTKPPTAMQHPHSHTASLVAMSPGSCCHLN